MGVYALEQPSAYDAEFITIDATAGGIGLTSSKINPSGNQQPATRAVITVETAPLRYLIVPPATLAVTAALGHLLQIGDSIIIEGPDNIVNFRAIRSTGVSASIMVTYQSG